MAARSKSTTIPAAGKHITFDRLTKDWAMHLDGEYIGSRATYREAEAELDRVAYEHAARLAADLADEAAERDAEAEQPLCPHCGGTGQAFNDWLLPCDEPCSACRGSGFAAADPPMEPLPDDFLGSDAGHAAAERRLAREAAQGYPLRADPPIDIPDEPEGTPPGGPEPPDIDWAAQWATDCAAAHQLGSGPALWFERLLAEVVRCERMLAEFDIDAAGARADHLVPLLASWSSAPLPTPAERIPTFAAPEAVWPDRLVA